MGKIRSSVIVQTVRLRIRGDAATVKALLPNMLAEEGLQLDRIIQPPVRKGLMDVADIVLTVVISIATAQAANYAQDKHISDKIDGVLERLKAKAVQLVQWSHDEPE